MDQRKIDLANWTRHQLMDMLSAPGLDIAIHNLSGDASFRRYFRAEVTGQTFVLVDAPPEKEDSRPFVRIAASFRAAGLRTPQVLRMDFDLGFMLLEDFGDQLYLPALKQAQHDRQALDALYFPAIEALIRLQSRHDTASLPPYDRALLHREMQLFEEWFCRRYLNIELSMAEQQLIADTLQYLEDAALEQVQTAVHRDYHSRNLMIVPNGRAGEPPGPGVLDFQDAVCGPYTYDLVSLLRDCYIKWPPEYVEALALRYKQMAEDAGIIRSMDKGSFLRQFDLMGLQRHLKVIGIFARLHLRDSKPQYLDDIPLVINYFLEVARRHDALGDFVAWFEDQILPPAIAKLPSGATCAQ